jgi:glycosyltransferase involved in cell wall biosynthesis
MRERIRALVLAETSNPDWVSVPLVGWSHGRALSRRADVHVVTQVRNREGFLGAGCKEGEDFTSIDNEAVAGPTWKLASLLSGGAGKGFTTLMAFSLPPYYAFEQLVWRRFGARIAAGEWDVVHRLTPLSPTIPSILASRLRRVGVPFVVGPLNGGTPWPKMFDGLRRRESEWLSYVRGAYRLAPGYRATLRDASALIVGSRDTLAQIPERHHDRCVYVPENAVDLARFPAPAPRATQRPLRVVFLGRLVPYKCADVLVEAAAELCRSGQVQVDILGDGPDRERIDSLRRELGVESSVNMRGWVSHKDVPGLLAQYDVLGFPSIREFGGGVALEAMAVGLVPLIVEYGGPAELVTEQTGYSVPLGPRAEIVAALRRTLEHIVSHPEELERKRLLARERVERWFTWDAKAGQTLAVYDWVLGRAPKPDFGTPFPDAHEVTPESVFQRKEGSFERASSDIGPSTHAPQRDESRSDAERRDAEDEEVA